MGKVIGSCVLAIVALSPLLRRLYIEYFWIHARGTVTRLDGGISQTEGTWVWAPIIEYQVAGQRFSGNFSYWQRASNRARSKYSVGDEVEIIYDPRRPARFIPDSWREHVSLTTFLCLLIAGKLFSSLTGQ